MRTNQSVEPSLGWTYLSRKALTRAKAQMDEESTGVRDEVGFLTIHQRYADRFFPGTSVLHARVRYALFVPWLFEDLAGETGPKVARMLRERERMLAGRLKEAKEEKVIGGNVYPKPSSQPPSTVYWNALGVWGILRPRADGRSISRAQAHLLLKGASKATDDDGQPLVFSESPFILLPKRPKGWLDGKIDLRLSTAEARFLRARFTSLRRSGSSELSLLARLVRTEAAAPHAMWADQVLDIAASDRTPLRRAQCAAALAAVGRAVYDALLEDMIERVDKRSISRRHRDHLVDVVAKEGHVAMQVRRDALEADIGVLPDKLGRVIEKTRNWVDSGAADFRDLFDVYVAAEARKKLRARLAPTANARQRRLEWARDEHTLAAPLHYRWGQVKTMLDDLANAR
ncbi:conserved hypothetical protein [Cupriavidus taiwanensis]|uniref:DUF6361 family protein n=1 Tax=Cupriavidus taiwanensis TaxID=164546 RepID=UPI000E122794|nr:DUF6361 family protein [Cupriavidus taiwanensis]SPA36246.1 conserved hypothetical protein [Cupriavidus taiwanensis]